MALQSKSIQGEMSLFFTANFSPPQEDDAFVAPPSEITPSHRQSMSQTHNNEHITLLPVMFITWDAVREREREMHTHSDKDARTHTYTHTHAHTIQKEQFLLPLYTPSPKHIIMYVRIMLTHLYILRVRICLRIKRVRVRVCAKTHPHTHFV